MIRMEQLGVFKFQHSDSSPLKAFVQCIIKAMRYRFKMEDHAPVLHCSKKGYLGATEVSETQLTPNEIINNSYILRDAKYHKRIREAVQAQIRKPGTNKSSLIRELDEIIQYGQVLQQEEEESMEAAEQQYADAELTCADIKECVTYVIQSTPKQWLLAVLGFFFYDVELYTKVTHSLPCYLSPEDKQNGIITWIDVPFFKVPGDAARILMIWCGIPLDDFPIVYGPFVDEMHLLSYLDSTFSLSSNIHNITLNLCKTWNSWNSYNSWTSWNSQNNCINDLLLLYTGFFFYLNVQDSLIHNKKQEVADAGINDH